MTLKPSPLSGFCTVVFVGGPLHKQRQQINCSVQARMDIEAHDGLLGCYIMGEGAARGKMLWKGDPICRRCGDPWVEH